MTNTEQTYRLRSYAGGFRNGLSWLRGSNTPGTDQALDRAGLDRQLQRLRVPAVVQGQEVGTHHVRNLEVTWAPVGQCPNAWHRGESMGAVSRCPDCPPLTDHAEDGNLTATTVLNEVMQKLGLPGRQDLLQHSARTGDQDTHGALGASVEVRVPRGPRYRITVTEL
jgi:hypothetical protein